MLKFYYKNLSNVFGTEGKDKEESKLKLNNKLKMKDIFLWKFLLRKTPKLELLKRSYIFKGLSKKEIYKLLDYLHERRYQKGEEIIRYGEPGYALYILVEGEVIVKIPGEKELIEVDTLRESEFFGEMALVTDAPRTATILCKTEVLVYVLTRSALEELIKIHPKIAAKLLYNISSVIAERLKKLNESLKNL